MAESVVFKILRVPAAMAVAEDGLLPWWQWSVFSDVGRVNDKWEFDELHKDMKYSLGAGIRPPGASACGNLRLEFF